MVRINHSDPRVQEILLSFGQTAVLTQDNSVGLLQLNEIGPEPVDPPNAPIVRRTRRKPRFSYDARYANRFYNEPIPELVDLLDAPFASASVLSWFSDVGVHQHFADTGVAQWFASNAISLGLVTPSATNRLAASYLSIALAVPEVNSYLASTSTAIGLSTPSVSTILAQGSTAEALSTPTVNSTWRKS